VVSLILQGLTFRRLINKGQLCLPVLSPESNPPRCQRPQTTKQRKSESNNCSIRRSNLVIFVSIILIALIALIVTICYSQSMAPTQCIHFVDKVKQRYKKHLPDVAQSFWLPANMDTFIPLSLTSQDKPRGPEVHQDSANPRIVSERSLSFDNLLSEIDASPGSRILVVGQPGIGKTTLLQRITRYWAHDRALSSCWVLLHIVLRDLVLLQNAPNLTTFLSFMGSITLPPDIETFVLESDGKGVCFIADGLDEFQAGYKDGNNFIFSEMIGPEQKPNIKLPQSTVVISSRPEVASRVRHLFDKHVEVLGFGDDQINKYIQEKYGEDKSFSKYLDDHPHIKDTCYIPLHLAMLVYIKDSLLDSTDLPKTETEVYEQFIFHTLIRDFCKSRTSSCSLRVTLPTSVNDINKLPEVERLLFHIANLSYIGSQKGQSIFTEVEPVLQHTNSSLLVVDKMGVLQPTTYSFPHLTIQEFLAAFYFNTYLSQQEQRKVYSFHQMKFEVGLVFWRFCCGLKRNENQTTFLEFFNLLYQYNAVDHYRWSILPYHCAHEAQSLIASQQLINFTGGIAADSLNSYYDAASFAFVAVSAAQTLRQVSLRFLPSVSKRISKFFLRKLCDATTNYSQLRKVWLIRVGPSNIGCLLQKSPNLESLHVSGGKWDMQSEDAAALVLPPYIVKLLNIRLDGLNIDDKGVKKVAQLLQGSIYLETLSLVWNSISDDGASAIADLIKALPHLQHVYLHGNHIGGTGAALLWNQSIHKCCNLDLDRNVIGNDRPDAFISALNGTINSGYERNKSCQLEVRVTSNGLLCSDLRDVRTFSKRFLKGVTLITGHDCLKMTDKMPNRYEYHVRKKYLSSSRDFLSFSSSPLKQKAGKNYHLYDVRLQWVSYVVCTFHIFYSTGTPLWGLLYFSCCLTIYILSSFNYLVLIGYFNFTLSFLWFWIVVDGRVSVKLFFKPRCWVLIIVLMVKLYFIDLKLIDYQ